LKINPELRQALTLVRSRLSDEEKAEAVREVKRRLVGNKKSFEMQGVPARFQGGNGRIRIFEVNDKKVAVKYCGSDMSFAKLQGFQPDNYLRFFREYKRAVRAGKIKPESYVLVKVRPFGTFEIKPGEGASGYYLVMEYIHQPEIRAAVPNSIFRAKCELDNHVRQFEDEQGLLPVQTHPDIFILGNTNPKDPSKGKWIFALPHDRV